MVYLDNAATTPLNTAAISAMTHVMTETFGNPSSLHAYGRQASKNLVRLVKKWPSNFKFLLENSFSPLVGLRVTIQLSKVMPLPIKLGGNT